MSGPTPSDALIEVASNINDDYFWYKEVYDADVVDVNSPLVRRVVMVADVLSSHPDIAGGNSFSVTSDKRAEDGEVIVEVKCEPNSEHFDDVISLGTIAALILSRITIVGSPMAILSVVVAKEFAPDNEFLSALDIEQGDSDDGGNGEPLGDIES